MKSQMPYMYVWSIWFMGRIVSKSFNSVSSYLNPTVFSVQSLLRHVSGDSTCVRWTGAGRSPSFQRWPQRTCRFAWQQSTKTSSTLSGSKSYCAFSEKRQRKDCRSTASNSWVTPSRKRDKVTLKTLKKRGRIFRGLDFSSVLLRQRGRTESKTHT